MNHRGRNTLLGFVLVAVLAAALVALHGAGQWILISFVIAVSAVLIVARIIQVTRSKDPA